MEILKTIAITFVMIGCTMIMMKGCFMYVNCKPEDKIPTKDGIQQLINKRLAPDMRIRVDGQIGTETLDAWDYVLKENHNQLDIVKARLRWGIPEIDLTKGAE